MGPIRSEFANDAGMRELVEMFVQDMPQKIQALQEALASGELTSLRRLAHQMKGACGGYGFSTLGEEAGKLEAALDSSQDLEAVQARVNELVSMCSRVAM